jgi:hypothetical protein
VFEIGSSLREAREQRDLSHADVERHTRIRTRYLRALEEETFELLPGTVYAKGFLRAYADYLGLDGQRFVDELASRLPAEEEPEAHVPLQPIRRRRLRISRNLVAGIGAAVAVAGVAIWLVGAQQGTKKHVAQPQRPATKPQVVVPEPPRNLTPRPQLARLTLRATRGACWLDARAGSPTGTELRSGMLESGHSLRLQGKRIWIRLGDPTVLDATLDGRRVALPATTPVNVLVTRVGVRAVA